MSTTAKRSSTDTQEKDLILDKDMEKDTWNFKSMTDDDPMDFGFDLPANNKKISFKLDMGLDLDKDFGNLSSFSMDMPDFDFSSPAKKTTKKKESSDDKTIGNSKQKKNPFAFSYDFDPLDDFNLDSSPPKKGIETTTKTISCEENFARRKTDKSDALDFGPDVPITGQAASIEDTNVKAKSSAENENQISKTTETTIVNSSSHSKQATSDSMEISEAVEPAQSTRTKTSPAHTMHLQPQSVCTSPLKTSSPSVEEAGEPCPSNENAAPSPLHASETAHTAVNRKTSPDIHEICRSGPKEHYPIDPEQNASHKMIFTMESSYEKTEQTASDISSQLCLDKIEHQREEMDTGTQAEIQDHTRRNLCHPDSLQSQTSLSGKISPGTCPSQTVQIQDSSAKLSLVPSHSMPGLSDLKTMQNKDSGLIISRYFKKLEEPESHVLKSSPTRTKIQPVTRERIGLISNPTNDRRHDTRDALPGAETGTCPIELVNTDSEEIIAKVNTNSSREKIIHKDHSNGKTVESADRRMDHIKLQAKHTTKEKSILQINISSKLNASSSTQKLTKHLSSGAESLQKSKITSLGRPKPGNIMPDLRAAKTLREIRVNKDQPSSAVRPEVSSSISKERYTETSVEKSSEIHHLAPRDKTLHCLSSLKRKALEEDADRSLKPERKRFSMSPRENRNVEELTHRVAKGLFSSQESRIDNKTSKELIMESPPTKSHHHQITNMANLEIPMTENTDNIERAEAFTKELDNICNILKKKHEEAKELLVRAIVNNNKLLMLNHPSHEDKIRMVQNFAAKLTLRDA